MALFLLLKKENLFFIFSLMTINSFLFCIFSRFLLKYKENALIEKFEIIQISSGRQITLTIIKIYYKYTNTFLFLFLFNILLRI